MHLRQTSAVLAVAAVVLAACLGLVASHRHSKGAMPSGSAWGAGNYTKIEVEAIVAGTRADAWRCWSTSEGAETFFAPHAEIGAYPGGPFEIWFFPNGKPGERGAEDLHVLSVLPGEMISFEWSAPPQFAHARPQRTWVVVTFEAVDSTHTRVRLVHLGWDQVKAKNPGHEQEWNDVKAYFEAAWPKVLGWMRQRFEEGPRWSADGTPQWKSEQTK